MQLNKTNKLVLNLNKLHPSPRSKIFSTHTYSSGGPLIFLSVKGGRGPKSLRNTGLGDVLCFSFKCNRFNLLKKNRIRKKMLMLGNCS